MKSVREAVGINKKMMMAVCLVIVMFLGVIYLGTLETESGTMFVLNKANADAGNYVLTVAKDGVGAVYELSCTSEQGAMVEAGDAVSCRWTLNLLTHSGRILEIYEV